MKIFIDPGHGGWDNGAQNLAYGLRESMLNLDMALILRDILQRRGHTVRMSRTTDVYVGLAERAAMANQWGADYFVSIHNNANDNPAANGTETLYHPNSTRGRALAAEVQRQALRQLGLADRGIIPRPNLAVLRLTNMPAIMTEFAFISNPREATLLTRADFRAKAAQAVADGLTQYMREQGQV